MESLLTKFNKDIGSALLSSDIWQNDTGESLASINRNINFSEVFRNVCNYIEKNLEAIGLPPVKNYQIIDLEMETILLFVKLDEKHTFGCIIDKSKVALSTLTNITVPNLINWFEQRGE